MAEARPFNDPPIPTLAEWLGDGTRAEGFERWVCDGLQLEGEIESEADKLSLRVMRTLGIACVEILRSEHERSGSSIPALVTLARCAGVNILCAALNVIDVAKLGSVADLTEILDDEFRVGMARIAEHMDGVEEAGNG